MSPDADDEAAPAPRVEVVRSARRRRTVSARRAGDRILVQLPAGLSPAEESRWVDRMVARVLRAEARSGPDDDELLRRALALSARHLGGRAVPTSVRWVEPMASRWGSCTVADGTIRLSRRLQDMPGYVVDYVVLHELAHLLVAGHGPRFWALLDGVDRVERARGYLEAAARLSPS